MVVIILFGCFGNPTKPNAPAKTIENKNLVGLDLFRRKKIIDSLANDTNALIVYAKVPNNLKPIIVQNVNSLMK